MPLLNRPLNRVLKKALRRPFMLLEVLIALMLVTMCIFPLVSPHVYVYRLQLERLREGGLYAFVTSYFADLLEKMYLQQIPIDAILRETPFPIDDPKLAALEFRGSYHFKVIKRKPLKDAPKIVFIVDIAFTFTPIGMASKGTPFIVTYPVCIVRDRQELAVDLMAKDKDKKNQGGKPKGDKDEEEESEDGDEDEEEEIDEES